MIYVVATGCAIVGAAVLAFGHEPTAGAIVFGAALITMGLSNLNHTLRETTPRR